MPMDCSLKEGKVVIVLKGRFAGRKAVVIRDYDGSKRDNSFPKVLLAGVDKSPLKVTRRMSNKKISRRTRVKPFVKFVNQNHVMPTRSSPFPFFHPPPPSPKDMVAVLDVLFVFLES